ncbi:hypothetical protein ACOMHN_056382 [Nucella lapillus]
MCKQAILMPLLEISAYLTKREVKKHRATWYKGLEYQVDNVLLRVETLQQTLDKALQDRNWVQRDKVMMALGELVRFFHEGAKEPVDRCYMRQQDQQKQRAAASEMERQHQEKLLDGMVEEPSDILNVVEQPTHGAGPNAQGGRGHGRGRGRYGGQGYHRPRGGRGRGGYREQGPVGEGQFEKGDLPPRFHRH